jgi:hypothetical protein
MYDAVCGHKLSKDIELALIHHFFDIAANDFLIGISGRF